MDGSLPEWLHLLLRWFHVIAGVMWIGQTYLFNFMERTMAEEQGPDGKLKLWMVHGGGFYLVEKQKVPEAMPRTLHWFRFESLFTWISGMLLLAIVYYMGGLLTDPRVSTIGVGPAVALSLGLFVAAWFVYDLLWRSPLGKNEALAAASCYALVVAVAYGLLQVYSARAAYMHVGALFGTIMVTNVWRRILPGQDAMIGAVRAGREPDMTLGARGKNRSKHNTFMSVPLIFIMISNHFPVATYGSAHPLLTLAALVLVGWIAAKFIRDYA